jgi:D-hydroxyproline dehydrogenase subunit beta
LPGNRVLNVNFDIAIVGAGIVGAACADACARAGLKVVVLDRGPIGGGTTAAGMGHLVVMDDSVAQFELTHYSRRLWGELARELPPEVEYDRCGTLWVAADEPEMSEARRKERFFSERGVAVVTLDAASLERAEPNLRGGLAGGLCVLEDAVLYPPSAARFLLERARRHHAEIRTGVEVKTILSEGGVVLANGDRIAAGITVIAAGCGSPDLAPGLPVRKRKGHLVITDRYPGYVNHQIVELGYLKSAHATAADSVAFNIQPRKTGKVLIGSSRQYGVEHDQVDADLLRRMLRRAFEYLPGLPGLSVVRTWTGHRAATPDKLPLIGPSNESERIWPATGHEGLGITTSLGTGQLLADMILGRATAIPVAPYSPARLTRIEAAHG